jgi:hypothetical protein
MENNKNLKEQKYRGIIVAGHDPTTQGRYKIFIHTLMHQSSENPQDDWVWAKNRTHSYRIGKNETNYGQYFPLHVGQHCYIKFETNDINSAYISELIDDVISTSVKNTLPFNSTINDRDEVTVLAKTLKNHHSIVLTEASSSAPNSIQIVYNNGSISLVFDGNGVHLNVSGSLNITTSGDINIKAGGNFNVMAGTINLKGPINASPINGTITHADLASGMGGGGSDSAAGNSGYGTATPTLIGVQ